MRKKEARRWRRSMRFLGARTSKPTRSDAGAACITILKGNFSASAGPDIDDELDIINPPDEWTAISKPPGTGADDPGAVWQNPEDVWGDEIWDQKVGELLRQMPNGWELTHVEDAWYCGRYIKGGRLCARLPHSIPSIRAGKG